MALIVTRKDTVPHPGHWILRHPETGMEFRHPELGIVYKDMRSYCAGNKMTVPTMLDMDAWICAQQPQQCGDGELPLPSDGLTGDDITRLFPTLTDRTLLGNRIAVLTRLLGVPPCGSCGARQEWLNKAHQWVRDHFPI